MNALTFLISTLFDLYLMVVILRIWLQLARADFYNPFSQFIVKATHPFIAPMRRILPSMGRFDTASFVLALIVVMVKVLLISLIAGGGIDVVLFLIFALVSVVKKAVYSYFGCLLFELS